MSTCLPGKMDYPRYRSGKLPDESLHVSPSNYQELPENSPKYFLLALKRVTEKMQLRGEQLAAADVANSRRRPSDGESSIKKK